MVSRRERGEMAMGVDPSGHGRSAAARAQVEPRSALEVQWSRSCSWHFWSHPHKRGPSSTPPAPGRLARGLQSRAAGHGYLRTGGHRAGNGYRSRRLQLLPQDQRWFADPRRPSGGVRVGRHEGHWAQLVGKQSSVGPVGCAVPRGSVRHRRCEPRIVVISMCSSRACRRTMSRTPIQPLDVGALRTSPFLGGQ